MLREISVSGQKPWARGQVQKGRGGAACWRGAVVRRPGRSGARSAAAALGASLHAPAPPPAAIIPAASPPPPPPHRVVRDDGDAAAGRLQAASQLIGEQHVGQLGAGVGEARDKVGRRHAAEVRPGWTREGVGGVSSRVRG
jgi:hypothetical protein